ncbi:MAG: cysteine desulfurase [Actinobacteria bacterium]|nr:MAG: cysteine desulfurase [Actinomycetota bacterium]
MNTKPIYLDYNATTPMDPRVTKAMIAYLKENFGNPSSSHYYGKITKDAVSKARIAVAELIGAGQDEIIFTSGGSESNNMAIKGIAFANKDKGRAYRQAGNHIITSSIEHPSIINPCGYLEKFGFKTTYLPVDKFGLVSPKDVKKALTKETLLVTIMHANNEVGTIEPIAEIGEIVKKEGLYFHSDAAQSVGKIPTLVNELRVDLLTIAAHKFYGPKGVGALYIRQGTKIDPLIHGASHEAGKRAGTENIAAVVGLAEAARIAPNEMGEDSKRIQRLRDKLYAEIKNMAEVKLNGATDNRLPNTLNISFKNINGAELLAKLKGIAASTGSACHEKESKVSGVLQAMGVKQDYAQGSIRFSLGKYTTEEDINNALGQIAEALLDKLFK